MYFTDEHVNNEAVHCPFFFFFFLGNRSVLITNRHPVRYIQHPITFAVNQHDDVTGSQQTVSYLLSSPAQPIQLSTEKPGSVSLYEKGTTNRSQALKPESGCMPTAAKIVCYSFCRATQMLHGTVRKCSVAVEYRRQSRCLSTSSVLSSR